MPVHMHVHDVELLTSFWMEVCWSCSQLKGLLCKQQLFAGYSYARGMLVQVKGWLAGIGLIFVSSGIQPRGIAYQYPSWK